MAKLVISSVKFSKTHEHIKGVKEAIEDDRIVRKHAKSALSNLKSKTPRRTGLTASKWSEETKKDGSGIETTFYNSNLTSQNQPIAILLDKGHYTRNGGYVRPRNFIEPVMNNMVKDVSKDIERRVISGK